MGIRKQLVVILLLMLGTCAQGQTISYNHKAHHSNTLKKNLSFNDMILIIAHQNPALKAISLNQELAKTHLETEKSNLWPQFSIGGSLQKNPNIDSNLPKIYLKSSWKNTYGSHIDLSISQQKSLDGSVKVMPSVHISQPLLKGFGRAVNTEALFNTTLTISLNHIEAQEKFSQEIVRLYEALIQYHVTLEKINYTKEMIKINNQQQFLRKKKIEAGEIAATELDVIEYSTQKMQIRLIESQDEKLNILNEISHILGASITEEHIPKKIPQLHLSQIDSFSAKELEDIAFKYAYEKKRQKIELQKFKRHQAVVDNQSQISANIYLNSESWQKPTEYGLQVTIPLNNPQTIENQKSILIEKDKLLIAHAEYKRQLHSQCDRYHQKLVNAKRAAKFAEIGFKEASKVYHTYRKKYEFKMVSALELEKAFLDCYDSGILKLEKEAAIVKTKLEILHAVGFLLPTLNIKLEPNHV